MSRKKLWSRFFCLAFILYPRIPAKANSATEQILQTGEEKKEAKRALRGAPEARNGWEAEGTEDLEDPRSGSTERLRDLGGMESSGDIKSIEARGTAAAKEAGMSRAAWASWKTRKDPKGKQRRQRNPRGGESLPSIVL